MTSNPIAPMKESAPRQMPEDATQPLQAVSKPGRSPEVKKGTTRPGPRSPRRRTIRFLLGIGLIVAVWWGAGYLFAYTDDAYLTSDLVSVAPEVTGPVVAVHVTDNQWVTRGTPLFTIDPRPFRLELERARAQEAEAQKHFAIAIDELRDWAYTGAPLAPLKGYPGVVWERPRRRKRPER